MNASAGITNIQPTIGCVFTVVSLSEQKSFFLSHFLHPKSCIQGGENLSYPLVDYFLYPATAAFSISACSAASCDGSEMNVCKSVPNLSETEGGIWSEPSKTKTLAS